MVSRERVQEPADFISGNAVARFGPVDIDRKVQLRRYFLLFLESIEQRPARYLMTLAVLFNGVQRFGIPFHYIFSRRNKNKTQGNCLSI